MEKFTCQNNYREIVRRDSNDSRVSKNVRGRKKEFDGIKTVAKEGIEEEEEEEDDDDEEEEEEGKLAVKRVHLVCFRLRLHGRTPAAYDVRLVTSRMNQPAILFAHWPTADSVSSSPYAHFSRASSHTPFRFYSVLVARANEASRIHASDPSVLFATSLFRPSASPFPTTESLPSSSIFLNSSFRVYRGKRLSVRGFSIFRGWDWSTVI